jgi:hypothetical protein
MSQQAPEDKPLHVVTFKFVLVMLGCFILAWVGLLELLMHRR